MKPSRMGTSAVMIAAVFNCAAAQDTGRLEFEVAMVKPAAVNRITDGATSTSSVSHGRLEVRGYTLKALVRMAYRIQDYQIVGGPKWFYVDSYGIDAKSPTRVHADSRQEWAEVAPGHNG
jgi:uncharacterized protein (TIGR03435 family)